MGNNAVKKQILHNIDRGKADKLVYILKKYPQFINVELNEDNNHTPLIQAIWQQNYTIARILLADFNSDPNKFSGRLSPLIAAVIKDNLDLIELLVQFKVNLKQRNQQGLTAMDFAILYGSYHAAYSLNVKYSIRIGVDIQKYQNLSQRYNVYHVNYTKMIELLAEGKSLSTFPGAIFRKQQEPMKNVSVIHSNNAQKKPKNSKMNQTLPNAVVTKQNPEKLLIQIVRSQEPTLELKRGKLTQKTLDESPLSSKVQQ